MQDFPGESLKGEAYKIMASHDAETISDDQHAVYALLNEWDDAVSLARDLHRWVRSWIA